MSMPRAGARAAYRPTARRRACPCAGLARQTGPSRRRTWQSGCRGWSCPDGPSAPTRGWHLRPASAARNKCQWPASCPLATRRRRPSLQWWCLRQYPRCRPNSARAPASRSGRSSSPPTVCADGWSADRPTGSRSDPRQPRLQKATLGAEGCVCFAWLVFNDATPAAIQDQIGLNQYLKGIINRLPI
ncbi:hypothetical protein D3C72_1374390 [compost metagenome]